MADLQITVTEVADTNFGDHGEYVRRSHEARLDETVEQLVRRIFEPSPFGRDRSGDRIEIQVVVGHDGRLDPKTGETPF